MKLPRVMDGLKIATGRADRTGGLVVGEGSEGVGGFTDGARGTITGCSCTAGAVTCCGGVGDLKISKKSDGIGGGARGTTAGVTACSCTTGAVNCCGGVGECALVMVVAVGTGGTTAGTDVRSKVPIRRGGGGLPPLATSSWSHETTGSK